ncbi:MAG: TetR/AcrR family transcriptional regulator [Acidimicrobiales bacterium]
MANRQPYLPAARRKADILAATVALLAEQGPAALTLRQIAERAGVPHTIIVRHFGDKAGLIRQATLGEILRWADAVRAEDDPVRAFVAGFRYLCRHRVSGTALALALSGTARPQSDQDTFPVVETHVEVLVAAGMPRRAARDLALAAVTMIGGFVVGEDWWVAASRRRGAAARRQAQRAFELHLEMLLVAGLTRSSGAPGVSAACGGLASGR